MPYDSPAPPPGSRFEEILAYGQRKNIPVLAGCDANSHNTAWGSTNTNARGTALAEYIASTELVILNKGNAPTFLTPYRREIIDITVCTPGLDSYVTNWRVLNEESLSDHRIITFHLKIEPPRTKWIRNPRNTDWDRYARTLSQHSFGDPPPTNAEELDTLVDTFTDKLLTTFNSACPLRKENLRKNAPWWNSELKSLRKKARATLRQALSTDTDPAWELYQSTQKEYKHKCREAKKAKWEDFCTEVEGISATAKMHKLLAKDPSLQPSLLRKSSGEFTEDDGDTLTHLLETHFLCSSPNLQTRHRATPMSEYTVSDIVSTNKLRWALDSFDNFKSPGPDGIFPALLKQAPGNAIRTLEVILKSSLCLGHVPKPWKHIKVVFIPKPGRNDYQNAKAFRPISLSSFLLKTLERLVDRYIRDKCLKLHKLSDNQHAFRTGRSTDSALHDLIFSVEKTMQGSESVLGVFMDIEGAFDNTTVAAVAQAACDRGVGGDIIDWIEDMLTDRHLHATLNGVSVTATTRRGCPQGSVLAPLLWLLVVDGLLVKLEANNIVALGFADDIVVLTKGKYVSTLSELMQSALVVVENWCTSIELAVNPSKTKMILFTKNRKIPTFPKPRLFGTEIELCKEVK